MKTNRKTKLAKVVGVILVFALAISSVGVYGKDADAKKVSYKKYTKSITVKMKKTQKSKKVNLAKKLKKGDKIKTAQTQSKIGTWVIADKISAKKIKISRIDNYEGNTTFKLKTKKNGVINIKVKFTGKDTSSNNKDVIPSLPWNADEKAIKAHLKKYDIEYVDIRWAYPNGYIMEFYPITEKRYFKEKQYFEKNIAILQSQLADPDKTNAEVYKRKFKAGVPLETKKIDILEKYLTSHMSYAYKSDGKTPNKNSKKATWEDLYNGTFEGVCGSGASKACHLARVLGFNARYICCWNMDHAWLVIEATDASGIKYWRGVRATSFAVDLSWNQKMTKDNETYDASASNYPFYDIEADSKEQIQYKADFDWSKLVN